MDADRAAKKHKNVSSWPYSLALSYKGGIHLFAIFLTGEKYTSHSLFAFTLFIGLQQRLPPIDNVVRIKGIDEKTESKATKTVFINVYMCRISCIIQRVLCFVRSSMAKPV